MKKLNKTHFGFYTFCLVSLLFYSCQQSHRMHSPQKQTPKKAVIEDELTPTTSSEVIQKNGITYKPVQKKIKNAQAEILVGQVKMQKTKISYDTTTRQMTVTGIAHVYGENKNELSSTEFFLEGSHQPSEIHFQLKPEKNTKSNSSSKPVVKAQVTCLSLNENDDFDCSSAVVDFFIAYKKQVFTEQMELKPQKSKTSQTIAQPTPPPAVASTDPEETLPVATQPPVIVTQAEGQEESIDGRYQGTAETIDLNEIFSDDEAEEKVVPPTPVKPATAPKVPEKKDKPLTKDLQQTKAGDIRPINQAIGFPDNGRLRNATSVYDKQKALNEKAFFEIADPSIKKHYSTYDTAELIDRLGQTLYQIAQRKLYVSSISQKNGGKTSPHLSHQIGLDADMAYPATQKEVKFPVVVQMSTRKYSPSIYSIEQTYELFKFAFKQQDIKVDRIFVDRAIKKALCDYAKSKGELTSIDKDFISNLFQNIDHVDGHGDHFHIRIKCSSYDPACRQKIYAVNSGCQ